MKIQRLLILTVLFLSAMKVNSQDLQLNGFNNVIQRSKVNPSLAQTSCLLYSKHTLTTTTESKP